MQEDMIKCALHIKIEYEITLLPSYNCILYETLKRNYKLNASLK